MTGRIEFWFEFASTYSYLSAMQIEDACAARGVTLVWRPFLLGPIFAAQGWHDSPFNLFPAKGAYMWADMAREASRLGLPFQKPSLFPQNGITAARIVTAHEDAPWIAEFVRCVYAAQFAQDRDISDPATLRAVLTPLVPDADAILATAQDPEVKDALKSATRMAAQIGIFGAPTFMANDTLFWGNDRLEQALDCAAC